MCLRSMSVSKVIPPKRGSIITNILRRIPDAYCGSNRAGVSCPIGGSQAIQAHWLLGLLDHAVWWSQNIGVRSHTPVHIWSAKAIQAALTLGPLTLRCIHRQLGGGSSMRYRSHYDARLQCHTAGSGTESASNGNLKIPKMGTGMCVGPCDLLFGQLAFERVLHGSGDGLQRVPSRSATGSGLPVAHSRCSLLRLPRIRVQLSRTPERRAQNSSPSRRRRRTEAVRVSNCCCS